MFSYVLFLFCAIIDFGTYSIVRGTVEPPVMNDTRIENSNEFTLMRCMGHQSISSLIVQRWSVTNFGECLTSLFLFSWRAPFRLVAITLCWLIILVEHCTNARYKSRHHFRSKNAFYALRSTTRVDLLLPVGEFMCCLFLHQRMTKRNRHYPLQP